MSAPRAPVRAWHLFDARKQVVGRLAQRCALLLTGKHKPTHRPESDDGDFVVVVNADRVRLAGKRAVRKIYYSHSTYPGGLSAVPFSDLMRKRPVDALRLAVKGMLPNNRLRRDRLSRLRLFVGPVHSHAELREQLGQLRILPPYELPSTQEVCPPPAEPVPATFEPVPLAEAQRQPGTLPAPFPAEQFDGARRRRPTPPPAQPAK